MARSVRTSSGARIDAGDGRRIVVVVRRRIPSQNAAHYRHWSVYAKERDAWFVLLRAQLPPRRPVSVPVRLAIRSYRSRLIDYANLVGGAKMIPDCLVRLGWLRDDSPRWLHGTYDQVQVPRAEERTELEIELLA